MNRFPGNHSWNQGVATIQGGSVGRIVKESDSLSVPAARVEFKARTRANTAALGCAESARGFFGSDGEGGDGFSRYG